jgi:hypothetical protein
MNILFSCHCKYSQHSELLISSSKYGKFEKLYNTKIQNKYNIDNIYFIDTDTTTCTPNDTQYTNWNNIPSNSMDIIFLVHCPIYGTFFSDKYNKRANDELEPFTQISEHSMRILKPNGRLIIPTYSLPGKSHDIYIPINLQINLLQNIFKNYSVYHSTRLPVYFKSIDDGTLKGTYLIIEKKLKTPKYTNKKNSKKVKKVKKVTHMQKSLKRH